MRWNRCDGCRSPSDRPAPFDGEVTDLGSFREVDLAIVAFFGRGDGVFDGPGRLAGDGDQSAGVAAFELGYQVGNSVDAHEMFLRVGWSAFRGICPDAWPADCAWRTGLSVGVRSREVLCERAPLAMGELPPAARLVPVSVGPGTRRAGLLTCGPRTGV